MASHTGIDFHKLGTDVPAIIKELGLESLGISGGGREKYRVPSYLADDVTKILFVHSIHANKDQGTAKSELRQLSGLLKGGIHFALEIVRNKRLASKPESKELLVEAKAVEKQTFVPVSVSQTPGFTGTVVDITVPRAKTAQADLTEKRTKKAAEVATAKQVYDKLEAELKELDDELRHVTNFLDAHSKLLSDVRAVGHYFKGVEGVGLAEAPIRKRKLTPRMLVAEMCDAVVSHLKPKETYDRTLIEGWLLEAKYSQGTVNELLSNVLHTLKYSRGVLETVPKRRGAYQLVIKQPVS